MVPHAATTITQITNGHHKDSMKVRNIQYVFLLFVNPFIDIHPLTHGTMPVLAGIVVDVLPVAVFALA